MVKGLVAYWLGALLEVTGLNPSGSMNNYFFVDLTTVGKLKRCFRTTDRRLLADLPVKFQIVKYLWDPSINRLGIDGL